MDTFTQRFDNSQEGGEIYDFKMTEATEMDGGGKKPRKKLSPKSDNWRKKYLEMKVERDNLKQENISLKKKLNSKS